MAQTERGITRPRKSDQIRQFGPSALARTNLCAEAMHERSENERRPRRSAGGSWYPSHRDVDTGRAAPIIRFFCLPNPVAAARRSPATLLPWLPRPACSRHGL